MRADRSGSPPVASASTLRAVSRSASRLAGQNAAPSRCRPGRHVRLRSRNRAPGWDRRLRLSLPGGGGRRSPTRASRTRVHQEPQPPPGVTVHLDEVVAAPSVPRCRGRGALARARANPWTAQRRAGPPAGRARPRCVASPTGMARPRVSRIRRSRTWTLWGHRAARRPFRTRDRSQCGRHDHALGGEDGADRNALGDVESGMPATRSTTQGCDAIHRSWRTAARRRTRPDVHRHMPWPVDHADHGSPPGATSPTNENPSLGALALLPVGKARAQVRQCPFKRLSGGAARRGLVLAGSHDVGGAHEATIR